MPMETAVRTEIGRGAEATVFRTEFLGRDAVVKVRTPKGYRVPALDERIRRSRIRAEARLIRDARLSGLRTPIIYDVDLTECSITMEDIRGITVKKYLDEHPEDAVRVCQEIGRDVAKLHNAHLSHGDLTTSNMILLPDGTICFIDFSMGNSMVELEDIGVDMRLLERAFNSAHPKLTAAYAELIKAYCQEKTDAQQVLDKVQEIKDRGRYT